MLKLEVLGQSGRCYISVFKLISFAVIFVEVLCQPTNVARFFVDILCHTYECWGTFGRVKPRNVRASLVLVLCQTYECWSNIYRRIVLNLRMLGQYW